MSCTELLLPYVRWAANSQLDDPNRYVIGFSIVSTNLLGESIFIRGYGDVSSAEFSKDGSRFYITIRGKGRRLTGSTKSHLAASDTSKHHPGSLMSSEITVDADSQVIFAIDAIYNKVRIRIGDITTREITDQITLECRDEFFYSISDGRVYVMSLQYIERTEAGWQLIENPTSSASDEIPDIEAYIEEIEETSDPDDLEKIEGIGPKMRVALNEIGITTFAELASYTGTELRIKLQESNVNTDLLFVESWPAQAALASAGRWNALRYIQDALLDHGKPVLSDDLQKIYGIGPGLASRLDKLGITTFKQIAEADAEQLENDLREAGARIPYGTTVTWAHQAKLAQDFHWIELEAYQMSLHEMHDDLVETENEYKASDESA